MHLWRDDQDTKRRHVQHSLRQQARKLGGAGELVLDIDEAVCRVDGGLEQPRDLVDARIMRGLDLGPRDARQNVAGLDRHRGRPAVARRQVAVFDRAAGGPPAVLDQFQKGGGGFAIDHALDIVERRVWPAVGVQPMRIAGGVRAVIPAPDRQVEPAGERNRPVNDDDLLVLGRTERKAEVEAETKPVGRVRLELRWGIPLTLGSIERRKIPAQDVDPEFGPQFQQRLEKWTEVFGKAVLGVAGRTDEPGLAMDVPADDIDLMCGEHQRLAQRGEIGGGVVQDGQPPRFALSPDGVAGQEDG